MGPGLPVSCRQGSKQGILISGYREAEESGKPYSAGFGFWGRKQEGRNVQGERVLRVMNQQEEPDILVLILQVN